VALGSLRCQGPGGPAEPTDPAATSQRGRGHKTLHTVLHTVAFGCRQKAMGEKGNGANVALSRGSGEGPGRLQSWLSIESRSVRH